LLLLLELRRLLGLLPLLPLVLLLLLTGFWSMSADVVVACCGPDADCCCLRGPASVFHHIASG
jgi:hypothetical protein